MKNSENLNARAVEITREILGDVGLQRQVFHFQLNPGELPEEAPAQCVTTWADMARTLGPIEWAWQG